MIQRVWNFADSSYHAAWWQSVHQPLSSKSSLWLLIILFQVSSITPYPDATREHLLFRYQPGGQAIDNASLNLLARAGDGYGVRAVCWRRHCSPASTSLPASRHQPHTLTKYPNNGHIYLGRTTA